MLWLHMMQLRNVLNMNLISPLIGWDWGVTFFVLAIRLLCLAFCIEWLTPVSVFFYGLLCSVYANCYVCNGCVLIRAFMIQYLYWLLGFFLLKIDFSIIFFCWDLSHYSFDVCLEIGSVLLCSCWYTFLCNWMLYTGKHLLVMVLGSKYLEQNATVDYQIEWIYVCIYWYLFMHDIKQKINKHKIKSENQLKFCGSMAKMSIEW